MSDEGTVLDNIDLDLTGVELGPPQIDNQVSKVIISDAKATEKEGVKRLELKLTLQEAVTSTSGKQLEVGRVIPISVLLTPTGGLTPKRINESLGQWKAAALGLKEVSGQFGSPQQLVGREVSIKWKLSSKGFQNADPVVYTR